MNSISSVNQSASDYMAVADRLRAAKQKATQAATQGATQGANSGNASGDDSVQLSLASTRERLQAGRIAANEKQGNITSDEATQLYTQLGAIHQQMATDKSNDGGSLSTADKQSINAMQDQLSAVIHDAAHQPMMAPTPDELPQAV